MNSIESLKWRNATKKFDNTKILSTNKIDILKKAFNLTATSFGLQPIKMIVICDKKLQQKFVEPSFYQNQVVEASHLLVICIEDDTTQNDIDNYFDLEKLTRGVSEESISKFRSQLKEMYLVKTKEEIQQSAIFQTYIALGNLLTVCALEEIDSCPMEGFIPSKIDELLNLKDRKLKSVLMLPVGYRAEDDFMSSLKKVRKPLEETVITLP